jgi:hypothetical protein
MLNFGLAGMGWTDSDVILTEQKAYDEENCKFMYSSFTDAVSLYGVLPDVLYHLESNGDVKIIEDFNFHQDLEDLVKYSADLVFTAYLILVTRLEESVPNVYPFIVQR